MAEGAKLAAGIDWDSVRERMAAALRRTQDALDPPRGRADRILKARARALAAPPAGSETAEAAIDVIPFGLAGTTYLIESRYVCEALRTPPIAPVPRTAEFLRGVTNIRGELVPVFDLSAYFGLAAAAPAAPGLAVLGREQAEFAILVDWIEPATALARDDLLTAEAAAPGDRKHLLGLTRDGRPLLDGDALLGEPALFLND